MKNCSSSGSGGGGCSSKRSSSSAVVLHLIYLNIYKYLSIYINFFPGNESMPKRHIWLESSKMILENCKNKAKISAQLG